MGKRKSGKMVLWILAVVLWAQMFFVPVFSAEEEPDMYAMSYALTDGCTNRLLLGKQEEQPMANASTTKILTCIVTLENSSMDEVVSISPNAQNQPKVRLGIGEGEKYPLIDLLYGLMLESYNDCAVAIAEHVAGSEEEFAKMLNEKAEEIGCKDTYFITPNGLDEQNVDNFHHTTATDLCRMMAYCVWESPQKEEFLKITQTSGYQGTNGQRDYSFSNKNAFLNQMEGVLSGKTGYTAKAGYCYVAALEQNGEKYCIALLACGWPNNKNYKWQDAKTLFHYGLKNYDNFVLDSESIEKNFSIDGYSGFPQFSFLNKTMEVTVSGAIDSDTILLGKEESVRKEIILEENITLPIEKGQILGKCNYYAGDYLVATVSLEAKENGRKWNFSDVFKVILRQYLDF